MRYVDEIEAGCIAILWQMKVVEVIDSVIGESGVKYFICRALCQGGLSLHNSKDLTPLFVCEQGEAEGQEMSRDEKIFRLVRKVYSKPNRG